jgi:hypothetical protein
MEGKEVDGLWEWEQVSIEMKQESTRTCAGVVPVIQIVRQLEGAWNDVEDEWRKAGGYTHRIHVVNGTLMGESDQDMCRQPGTTHNRCAESYAIRRHCQKSLGT